MTKQEEIRQGIKVIFDRLQLNNPDELSSAVWKAIRDDLIKEILSYLHSQGVVLKVDRELPIFAKVLPLDRYTEFNNGYVKGQEFERDRALKAGYVVVEPLIEEGKE